jgi:hypothetical protein
MTSDTSSGFYIKRPSNEGSNSSGFYVKPSANTSFYIKQSEPIPPPVQPVLSDTLILGLDTATEQEIRISDEVRQSGTYILGIQGRGKSSLLEYIINQDIKKGYAVFVLDPHGDLIDHCIAQMPAERLKDAYLLDMEDESYPFGVNLFSARKHTSEVAKTQAVDRVMHVFEAVWGDVLKQQNLPRYLLTATQTLLENPGTTLRDMYPFLTNDNYRHRLLQKVKDPTIKDFWQTEYDDLTKAARRRETGSLVTRLQRLFVGRNLVSNILGQSHSTIDFRRAIENHEIIFIKLPIQTLRQDAALIGTMLIAQIHATVFSFKDLPLASRPTYSIFIDEFQHFVTPDIEEIYTGGRKFGSRLTIAHQFARQIPDYLVEAVITANTKIIFQPSPKDATNTIITSMFAGMKRRQENLEIDVISHLEDHAAPEVKEFANKYIPRLKAMEKMHVGERREHHPRVGYRSLPRTEIIEVYPRHDFGYGSMQFNPTDARNLLRSLNTLMYESQKYGKIDKAEVEKVLVYLSELLSFEHPLTRDERDERIAISYLPPREREEREQREEDTKRAKKVRIDQLVNRFSAELNRVLDILITQPIARDQAIYTAADIAGLLQRLERRHALVKTGSEIYSMETIDTPPPVSPSEERRRQNQIREQTRAKYCRSASEIEREIRQRIHGTLPEVEADQDIQDVEEDEQQVLDEWQGYQPSVKPDEPEQFKMYGEE